MAAPTAGTTVRYVTSDERTAAETARGLGAAIGQPDLQWRTVTDEQARSGMAQRGLPEPVIANSPELNAAIHSGALGHDYERPRPATLGQVKLEDFA